ncbi:MAG: ferrochelatase [Microthrixaceae bacterium]
MSSVQTHPVGVLVMAYGTPGSPEQVEGYYTHIRRGRPPAAEQLDDLVRRYDAIGGISPMRERTLAQLGAIEKSLDRSRPGGFVVALGQKHAAPFIENGVQSLALDEVSRIVGVVLAPHFSRASVGEYHKRAATVAAEIGVPYVGIDDWSLEPELISYTAKALSKRIAVMPERTKVVFTAHSLPERSLVDDPYPERLHASAEAVAEKVGLSRWAGWGLGWQSAGRTNDAWRGPDILTVIRDLAETGRSEGIIVVPQGFTSDHLEVLYDLDIEASAVAKECGLAFTRTDVVNDDPAVMAAIARRIEALDPQ